MENACDNDDDDDDHLLLLLLLPQDVLIQILVLLPVISLLRFKSVCKSWRALIQSSFFIDLHINNALPPHNNSYSSKFGTFIFQTSYTFLNRLECGAFMLSGDGGRDDDDENKVKLEHLCFPTCYKVCNHDIHVSRHEILMVGSWKGLICLHDLTRRDVSLWNPATRQFRLLPKSLTFAVGIGKLDIDFVAFGYDVKTKDYKVVQISCYRPYMSNDDPLPVEGYTFRVQVYSLSTDSWRVLEGINSLPALPYQGLGMNNGVYLNGSYCFMGWYFIEFGFEKVLSTRRIILSFDFTKEIFTTMQHPDEHHHQLTQLTYFGEKLAVFAVVVVNDDTGFQSYDIWVLNEHDMKESWTKVHSIGPFCVEIPRGISNNGEFAFITACGNVVRKINGNPVLNYKLQLLNLHTKQVKEDFYTVYSAIRSNVYKQSLVSVGGNGTSADKMIGGAM